MLARQCSIGAGLNNFGGGRHGQQGLWIGTESGDAGAQAIQCGDADVIVAGGTENMSRAPYLLDKARNGYRMGNGEIIDSMVRDGLWDVYNNVHMGICGDRCAPSISSPASSRMILRWPVSSGRWPPRRAGRSRRRSVSRSARRQGNGQRQRG